MTAKRFTVDSDGKWWDKIKHEYVTLDSLFKLVEELDYTINEMAKTIRIYDDGYIDLNKKYKKIVDENEQLKKENMEYYHLVNCGNCKYHNYDWFDDGDEFEVCEKGHTERLIYNKFCKEWREL